MGFLMFVLFCSLDILKMCRNLIGFIVIIIIQSISSDIRIKDDFMYCPHSSNDPILKLNDKCDWNQERQVEVKPRLVTDLGFFYRYFHLWTNVKVLSSLVNSVNGIGYECFKSEFTQRTWKSFFGMEHTEINNKTIQLTRTDCERMIATKRCGTMKMTCENDLCYYKTHIRSAFSWLLPTDLHGIECKLTKRAIVVMRNDSVVFNKCKASDLTCRLADSLVIWNNSIIAACPYSKVAKIDNLTPFKNNILFDQKTNHVFKIIKAFSACRDMEIFSTEQGLYLTLDQRADRLASSELDLSDIHKLMLSENDGEFFKSHTDFSSIHKSLCHEHYDKLVGHLNLPSSTFLQFTDNLNVKRVVYSLNRQLFLPKCIPIPEIRLFFLIQSRTDNQLCDSNPRVIFEINGTVQQGLLTHENIISNIQAYSKCSNGNPLKVYRYFPKSNKYYAITSRIAFPLSNRVIRHEELYSNSKEINFPHYNKILDQQDVFNEINVEINNKNSMEIIDQRDNRKVYKSIWNILGNIYNEAIKFVYLLIPFIVIIFVILAFKIAEDLYKRKFNKLITANNTEEEEESF